MATSHAVSNSSIVVEEHQGQNIVVAARLRPLSSKEIHSGQKSCCTAINESTISIKKAGDSSAYLKSQNQDTINNFIFDYVFDENSTQQEIYLRTIQKFVPKIHIGQNVTVFAYGATGAGKTYTMFGEDLERGHDFAQDSHSGIISRAVKDLLEQTEQRRKFARAGEVWITSFCFMEVYNEQVYDLLQYTGKTLSIREDADKGVIQVTGLSETVIESVSHFTELVRHGQKHRKMESTLANVVSSRSHAILQVVVRCLQRNKYGKETLTESKLSLIDLAGSERASRTGNTSGARQQEGANINKSLLALANCINALAENYSLPPGTRTSQKVNVKFRDSKLTHLLKSSLEGNSYLVMLANVNPSDVTYEDTLKTLYYAQRAKSIKVNPLARANLLEATSLEREIQLRAENEMLQKKVEDHEGEMSQLQELVELLEAKLAEVTDMKNATEALLNEKLAWEEAERLRKSLMTDVMTWTDLKEETEEVSCQVNFLPITTEISCQVETSLLERTTREFSCQTDPLPKEAPPKPVVVTTKTVSKATTKMVTIGCQTSKELLPTPEPVIVKVEVPVEVLVPAPAPEPVIIHVPVEVPAVKAETSCMECQTDPFEETLPTRHANNSQSHESLLDELDREMDLDRIYFVNELRKMKKRKGKKVTYDPILVQSLGSRDSQMSSSRYDSRSLSPTARTVREKIEQFEKYSPSSRRSVESTATSSTASTAAWKNRRHSHTKEMRMNEFKSGECAGDLFIYRIEDDELYGEEEEKVDREEEKEDLPSPHPNQGSIIFHKVLIEEDNASSSSAESKATQEKLFAGLEGVKRSANNRSNESMTGTVNLLEDGEARTKVDSGIRTPMGLTIIAKTTSLDNKTGNKLKTIAASDLIPDDRSDTLSTLSGGDGITPKSEGGNGKLVADFTLHQSTTVTNNFELIQLASPSEKRKNKRTKSWYRMFICGVEPEM